MKLSNKLDLISPSLTLAITAKANALKASGVDVINFGAGEPDFDTPGFIKEAAKKAIDDGFTKYTPDSGTKELKEAICQKLEKENGITYSPQEVIVSCGAKHSIYNAILAICNEDDEVLLPAPYWVSYPEQIKMAGARVIIIETQQTNNFKMPPEDLERAITGKTKLLILNSPSNPTGAVYSKEELEKIADIVIQKGIYVLSDEIYEKLIYSGAKHHSIASFNPEIKKLTILVNGVSKAYAMTGWRIGYTAGPKEIIEGMSKIQSHSTSNPTSISQKAALAALTMDQTPVLEMVAEFEKRRNLMVEGLNKIAGFFCTQPEGAFYAFPDVSGILGKTYQDEKIENSLVLAGMLLEKFLVAVVPGGAFGADNHIRLSYATSKINIAAGLERIKEFVSKII